MPIDRKSDNKEKMYQSAEDECACKNTERKKDCRGVSQKENESESASAEESKA